MPALVLLLDNNRRTCIWLHQELFLNCPELAEKCEKSSVYHLSLTVCWLILSMGSSRGRVRIFISSSKLATKEWNPTTNSHLQKFIQLYTFKTLTLRQPTSLDMVKPFISVASLCKLSKYTTTTLTKKYPTYTMKCQMQVIFYLF